MRRFTKFMVEGLILVGLLMANYASAWSGCDLFIKNNTKEKITYHVEWLDHNIKKYKGYWIPRCGGELKPGETYSLPDFLGIGRHRVRFYRWQKSGPIGNFRFEVGVKTKQILITPDGKKEIMFREEEKWEKS